MVKFEELLKISLNCDTHRIIVSPEDFDRVKIIAEKEI